MNHFHLALQLLRRDWRSGELLTLVSALLLATSAVFTIGLITDRLNGGMERESALLIGGDLVIESTREPPREWRQQAKQRGFATTLTQRFDSVVFHGDNMLLASIKAVEANYPLLGSLKVSTGRQVLPTTTEAVPSQGNAWVDPRVLDQLNAKLGDSIIFGATTLRLEKLLNHDPAQGSLFQLAPLIFINVADLAPAQVTGPGSRIRYRTLIHNDKRDAIDDMKAYLTAQMGPGYRLIEPSSGNDRSSLALNKASDYIRIAMVMAVVLSAIAIALAIRRYSQHHYDVSAMLRCLGAQQSSIVKIYSLQFLMLTLAAVLAALAIGWLGHLLIITALSPLLPTELPTSSPAPWLTAAGSALLLMTGFTLPPILRLSRTSPLRVLRRDLNPLPLSLWLVYGLTAVSLVLLLTLVFDDMGAILPSLFAVTIGIGCAGILLFSLLKLAKKGLKRSGSLLIASLRNLGAHAATSTSQIMAFAITLMMLIIITQLRTDLLNQWQMQLPDNAPNHFAFNILASDVDAFEKSLASQAELQPFYPVVRARLLSANGNPVKVDDNDNDRELNLTWSTVLPPDNTIVAGTWPPQNDGLSIEQDFARRLGVDIGDTLVFDNQGQSFSATVTSIRTVAWESLSPNFYLIFSPENLNRFPATYLTSFRLTDQAAPALRSLLEKYPAVSIIAVDILLKRMQEVLDQVSLTIQLVMVFIVLGGFAVLFATLLTTGDERRQENALLRSFGASRILLRRRLLTEFGLLGFGAGIIAIIASEIALRLIYHQAFELDYQPDYVLWCLLPLLSAMIIALAGYGSSRKVLAASPRQLLAT